VTLPALTEPESLDVPGVGPLEAFNTDGLRSLVDTVRADAMVERTLRYPGHLAAMRLLSDAGFFDTMPVRVGDQQVSPRQLSAALLFPRWQYGADEGDLTALRVHVSGRTAEGTWRSDRWLLVDRPEANGPLSSMARTTGCPAAITARWVGDGTFSDPGIHPPERLGLDGFGEAMLAALAVRGIHVVKAAPL
jgi:lysine 6-dehydrogenase